MERMGQKVSTVYKATYAAMMKPPSIAMTEL